MILVDVYVPSLARTYNFNLDEDAKISVLIEEISELICKKEHSKLNGQISFLVMGSVDQAHSFQSQYSLKDYSVRNGEKLILV